MYKRLYVLFVAGLFALCLYGCGGEKPDIEKDHLDPQSLKALENPPPGVPGAPPKAGTAPGAPAGAQTTPASTNTGGQ